MILAALILAIHPAPACVQVSGESILVRDLAGAVPALAALPPDEVLGYTPAPGARRLVSRRELARLAERHGLRLEPGPGLCVERAARLLSREELEAALRAALKEAAPEGMPEARLELLEFSRYPVPEGELEFKRAGLPAPPRVGIPVIWRGRVRYGGSRSVPVWARVRLAVAGLGVIAIENLRSGRPIEAHQVRVGPLEWFPFSEAPAREAAQVIGRAPRHAIPAGKPVLAGALMPAHQVERGETVTVEVSSGAARLSLQARAESGGSAGDSLVLRNPSSGRTFAGRVEEGGKVVVDANPLHRPAGSLAGVPVGTRSPGRGPRQGRETQLHRPVRR